MFKKFLFFLGAVVLITTVILLINNIPRDVNIDVDTENVQQEDDSPTIVNKINSLNFTIPDGFASTENAEGSDEEEFPYTESTYHNYVKNNDFIQINEEEGTDVYSDINHIPNAEEKNINGINGLFFKYTYSENPEYGFIFSDGTKIYTIYTSSEELLNTVLGGVN